MFKSHFKISERSVIKTTFMFRWVTLISTIITWPLISFGAFVRLKGAGLACPDWPLCYGKIIPPAGYGIALEVGHRFIATLLGLLIIWMFALTFKPHYRHYRFVTALILVLVCVQGILGGLTVLERLAPEMVVLHLMGGNILFAMMVYLSYVTIQEWRGYKKQVRQSLSYNSKMQFSMLVLILIILVSGGANSSTYSGYACAAFPGCQEGSAFSFYASDPLPNAHFFPKVYNEWIHMIHRLIAIVGTLIILILSWKHHYRHPSGLYRNIALATGGLLLLEICLGIINALYRVPVPISAAHTAVAATLVGVLSYSFSKSLYQKE